MNNLISFSNHYIGNKFSSLYKSVNKRKKDALKKRLVSNPNYTDIEYLLGAFLEMYEPHLYEVVSQLFKRGYVIEVSSGFSGNQGQYQSLDGYIAVDYITRNKLEKIGIKIREDGGLKSFIFWPEEADIGHIKKKWMQIVATLPDKGVLATPSTSFKAVEFRRKYTPKDPVLQRQRLFEQFRYNIQRKIVNDLRRRVEKNPTPNDLELHLGVFLEEIEPQVRQAVVELNKKGYSTDKSGFMYNPCDQMVEGDFQIADAILEKLNKIEGVTVATNSSGYTRIQLCPKEPNIPCIKKQWYKIVSLLPDEHKTAELSMTRKSREFRLQYG